MLYYRIKRLAAAGLAIILMLGLAILESPRTEAAPNTPTDSTSAHDERRDLRTKQFASYNMQGATTTNGVNKWTQDVSQLSQVAPIVALQEAGSPPGQWQGRLTTVEGHGFSTEISWYRWNLGSSSRPAWRNIFFLPTDPNGNRVNLAIVTWDTPDHTTWAFNSYGDRARSRDGLGVVFGDTAYYSIHARADGGRDYAGLLDGVIHNSLTRGPRQWIVGGDWNRSPLSISPTAVPGYVYPNSTGSPTHVNGGNLDYFITSNPVECSRSAPTKLRPQRLSLRSSDHYPVITQLEECRSKEQLDKNIDEMPMGASITEGVGSSSGNGYRAFLYAGMSSGMVGKRSSTAKSGQTPETSEAEVARLDFVGRGRDGSMSDPDHEGYSGYRIDQVQAVAACAVPRYRPNVVTLIVGTNDMIQNSDVENAPARLQNLIASILRSSPRAAVIVSALPPVTSANEPGANDRVRAFNRAIPFVVAQMQSSGAHVEYVDPGLAASDISPDGIHPHDEGYRKIADAFLDGIYRANGSGWIDTLEPDGELQAGCPSGADDNVSDTRWTDHGVSFTDFQPTDNIRFGRVDEDQKPELFVVQRDQSWKYYWNGGYTPNNWTWKEGLSRAPRKSGLVGHTLRFADLDGEGHADCVSFDGDGRLDVQFFDIKKPVGHRLCANQAKLDWNLKDFVSVPGGQFFFTDYNADGKDDVLYVRENGTSQVYLNTYVAGGTATWSPVRFVIRGATEEGEDKDGKSVYRWADLSGDGRADLIKITQQGGARAWRTRNAAPGYGLSMGKVLADTGMAPTSLRFIDVGGNGKADLLRVDQNGKVHIWVNKVE